MPHQDRIVGIDISKLKVDACVHSRRLRRSFASTPPGERELIAWRRDSVGLAVMEASDGYERGWAAALRKAGIAVRIVDPNRVRFFAKSAGRLAKSDPIRACPRAGQRPDPGAAMIAWFAETFTVEVDQPHDPDRGLLDRLMTARRLLVRLVAHIRQFGEHRQPRVVNNAQRAMIRKIRTPLAKLEVAVQARIAANVKLAAGGAIIHSVPGFGTRFVAAAIAWLPELGHVSNKAAAARSAICSIWQPSPPPLATTRLSRRTTNGCALTARRPTSLWSPACASSSSSSTPCWHAVRCGTRRSPPQPQPRSRERA